MSFAFEYWQIPVVFAVGVGASFVNSLAGGGSILSLPVFILLGMPQALAHGTNRLGLIPGAASSSWLLSRKGFIPFSLFLKLLIPVGIGTAIGTQLVIYTPDVYFNFLLAGVMVVLAFTTKVKDVTEGVGDSALKMQGWKIFVVFLALGFYTGFIQVGAGVVMMFVFYRCLNLNGFQINALKGATGVFFLSLSVIIFGLQGKVHWIMAGVFGLGSYWGGFLGARFQLSKGVRWIRWFLRIMGSVLAIKLILHSFSKI